MRWLCWFKHKWVLTVSESFSDDVYKEWKCKRCGKIRSCIIPHRGRCG